MGIKPVEIIHVGDSDGAFRSSTSEEHEEHDETPNRLPFKDDD